MIIFFENLELVLNNYFIYVIICIKVKVDHYIKKFIKGLFI